MLSLATALRFDRPSLIAAHWHCSTAEITPYSMPFDVYVSLATTLSLHSSEADSSTVTFIHHGDHGYAALSLSHWQLGLLYDRTTLVAAQWHFYFTVITL